MSEQELEAKVSELRAQRTKEFQDKGIFQKAVLVAEYLGHDTKARYPPKFLYKNNRLEIFWDGYGSYVSISYMDKDVVSYGSGGNLGLYHPFEAWENLLNRLAVQAQEIKTKREAQSKAEELQNELAKWE